MKTNCRDINCAGSCTRETIIKKRGPWKEDAIARYTCTKCGKGHDITIMINGKTGIGHQQAPQGLGCIVEFGRKLTKS